MVYASGCTGWTLFCRLERRNRKNASKAKPPITAMPPTVPPTIAPIGAGAAAAGSGVGVGVGVIVVEEDTVEDVVDIGEVVVEVEEDFVVAGGK
jgi:hypothetical protein